MRRIAERIARLEADADRAEGKGNMRVFLLDEGEPMPKGITGAEDDVLVVRFVGVSPVYDEQGSVIPCPPK